MTQSYYNYGNTLIDGSPAYASEVGNEFQGIESGFDQIVSDIDSAKSARDDEITGMVAAINGCVKKTGLDADLSAGGFKITNLTDGVDPKDAANIRTVKSLIFTGGAAQADMAITSFGQGDAENNTFLKIDENGNIVGVSVIYYTQEEIDSFNQATDDRMNEIELLAIAGLS